MSDSGPPDPSQPFVFGIPEEVKQVMQQQMENRHALAESNVRAQDEFLDSLNEDQLRMVRGFLTTTVEDVSFGNYMIGWISSILKHKHKVCQYCGAKHETPEEFLAAHMEGQN